MLTYYESARYDNLDIIEDAYGINPNLTLKLKSITMLKTQRLNPRNDPDKDVSLTKREESQITKIHQAIAMIQFKLEMPIIKRRPSFEMEERLVLEKIDYDNNEITIYNKTYPLKDTCFQTVNPNNPAELLAEEKKLWISYYFHSNNLKN